MGDFTTHLIQDDANPSRRLARRVVYFLPVNFQIENEMGTFAGELRNLSQSGALLWADRPLNKGSRVFLSSAPKTMIAFLRIEGEVVRCVGEADARGGSLYAVKFHRRPGDNDAAIKYVVELASKEDRGQGIPAMKMSILGGLFVGLPAILGLGNYFHPGMKNLSLAGVLILVAVERTLETFTTLRRKGALKIVEDWTISAVSFYYVCMILLAAAESLMIRQRLWSPAVVAGSLLLLAAMALRWWGMKALGKYWEIQLLGSRQWAVQSKNIALIKNGPYRYMRHPIYAGLVMELIGIPLMVNAFWVLGFVFLVNIPLQMLRMQLEEKQLLQIVGGDYARYMDECFALFPWHRTIEKMSQDRRSNDIIIDFAERRRRS